MEHLKRKFRHALSQADSRDSIARHNAMSEFGRVGKYLKQELRELVDALLKGMQDADAGVAAAATKSLAEVNPHGDAKTVSKLLTFLKHEKESVRLSAMAVLETVAESGDPDVLEGICDLLEDKSLLVRRTVASSLSRLAPRGHPGAIRGLYLRLWHPDIEIRCATLRAMGKAAAIGSEKERNEILKGLLDKSPRVRIHALEAIVGVAEKGDATAVAGVQACISDYLGTTDTKLRNRAIQALAKLTGEDGQGVAIEHQAWIEPGNDADDTKEKEEGPHKTDFYFIPTRPSEPDDIAQIQETQVFREAPLSTTAALGPINDMVLFWKRGRVSMMDMSLCRTSDHRKACYSNLDKAYLAHANFRTQAIFPGIRDSKFNVVIGPLKRGREHVVVFIYNELALEMPLGRNPARFLGETRTREALYPLAEGRGRVVPLQEVLPGWERMDENTLCAATGEWDDELGRTFWVFVDDKVWVFERKGKDDPIRQRHAPRKIKEFILDGPPFVESVVGPIACVECPKEKGWTMRRVLYLFAESTMWEYDIKSRTCVIRQRPEALPSEIFGFERTLNDIDVISRVSSAASSAESEMGEEEQSRHDALKRRKMDEENQVGGMKELFRPSRDHKLVDVGHKVARHIILEGIIPHVLEVLGEYTVIDDIWERSDRPLYMRSTIGLRSEVKTDIYMYWVWKGTSTLDPNGSGWWVIGDAPGAEDAALCVESDAMDPTLIKDRWMYWDGKTWQNAPDNFHVMAMDKNFDALTSKQHLTDAIKRHKEKADAKPAKGLEMDRIGNEKKAAKTDFEIIERLRSGMKGTEEKTGGRRKSQIDDLELFQQYHKAKQELMDGMKERRKAGEEKLVAWLAIQEKENEKLGADGKKRHVVWSWLDKLNSKSDGSDSANWRARLCVAIDGVFKYVSEKQSGEFVKICDFRNVDRVVLTGFEKAERPYCMEILFQDESKIIFSASTEFERARWEEEIARVIAEVDEAGGESPAGHFPGDEPGHGGAYFSSSEEDHP